MYESLEPEDTIKRKNRFHMCEQKFKRRKIIGIILTQESNYQEMGHDLDNFTEIRFRL
jgi:hypothetical protein